jgi:drug/metabolite transporter (DMT)-like permease
MRTRAEISLAAITIVWGSTFVLVQSALADISTMVYLALRFSVAGLALAILFRARLRGLFANWRQSLGGVLAGICLASAYSMQTAGLRYTTPSKSAFLTSLCVVMVPLFGFFVYRNVPQLHEALGIALAMIGLYLMIAPESGAWNRGDLLTVGCAGAFAIHILVLARFSPESGFGGISLLQILVAALLLAVAAVFGEPARALWRPGVVFTILFTGLACTAAAFTVQAWAQQFTTASRTALLFTLEPVSAALASYIALGELLTMRAAFGAAMILAGVLTVETWPRGNASTA